VWLWGAVYSLGAGWLVWEYLSTAGVAELVWPSAVQQLVWAYPSAVGRAELAYPSGVEQMM
jgi:hypothetical protein